MRAENLPMQISQRFQLVMQIVLTNRKPLFESDLCVSFIFIYRNTIDQIMPSIFHLNISNIIAHSFLVLVITGPVRPLVATCNCSRWRINPPGIGFIMPYLCYMTHNVLEAYNYVDLFHLANSFSSKVTMHFILVQSLVWQWYLFSLSRKHIVIVLQESL